MSANIFLSREEFDKIPETLRGEYHPNKNNHKSKQFSGNICVTLDATHRTYVVGRELMIVDPEDVDEKALRHIIRCENCKEISLEDTRHPGLCMYCASMFSVNKTMPGKDQLPDAMQKQRAAQDLAKTTIRNAKHTVSVLPDVDRNQLSFRFLELVSSHCSALKWFMDAHTGEFYDDQNNAVIAAIELLIQKANAEPAKYARAFNYMKRYVVDGIPLTVVNREYPFKQFRKDEVADFLKDCIGDDWQLRFIIGYDAANLKIKEGHKKKGKKNVPDYKIASECIQNLLKNRKIYNYIKPAEKIENAHVLNQSPALAEAEKVCGCLRSTCYGYPFQLVVYLESPFEKCEDLKPKWKKLETTTKKGDIPVYDILIPKQVRKDLYSFAQYVLTTLACIYAYQNEISITIEQDGVTCDRALAEIAFNHGLLVERIEENQYKILTVNDKVIAAMESNSWPKWLYFCIEDRREKKVIDQESGIKKQIINENELIKEFMNSMPEQMFTIPDPPKSEYAATSHTENVNEQPEQEPKPDTMIPVAQENTQTNTQTEQDQQQELDLIENEYISQKSTLSAEEWHRKQQQYEKEAEGKLNDFIRQVQNGEYMASLNMKMF